MSRYPRTCRGKAGPHVINGPEDEIQRPDKPSPYCLQCRREMWTRQNRKRPTFGNPSGRHKGDGPTYPRICRSGRHEITGSKDEVKRGPWRTCAMCAREQNRRAHDMNEYGRRRTESGKAAEATARWRRRKAQERDDQLLRELFANG